MKHIRGFSLIEVIIALGIFTFCIVGIFSLLPLALNSSLSVSQESNANNIAASIAGFWEVAPASTASSANFTMGNFTVGTSGNHTFYYNTDGREVALNADPSLKLDYEANALSPNSFTLNLTFTWPPTASANSTAATTRTFNYIFTQ